MGKGLPRVSSCCTSRRLHTAIRQRRDDFWSPPSKTARGDQPANATNHLINAGFLAQSNAGVYHFLPLGLRVLEKIERLIDKHMRSIGASKLSLSALSNQKLWRRSGRLDAAGELFKFTDRAKTDWLLAPTHEEEVTALVQKAGFLPRSGSHGLRLYQIGRKYRDEKRPRGGLLRGKEFIMKDLYTFDRTPADAHRTYDEIRAAYRRFFDELGVPYLEARADSGSMGGNLSHEYHFPNEQGEDTIITCSSCDLTRNVEFTHPIDRLIKIVPNEPPTGEDIVERSSITTRDFISVDNATLVRVLLPTKDASGAAIKNVKALINTHALKAALHGKVDLATGIEEAAANKIFFSAAGSDQKVKNRQIYYVLDKRLSVDHLAMRLRYENVPHTVDIWAVRSSSHDVSSPSSIDVLLPQNNDPCPSCKNGTLRVQNAIEMGHTFHLGTRYSEKFGFQISSRTPSSVDRNEPVDFVEMGCHGIGVSRLFAATTQLLPRAQGANFQEIRFPKAIAPFDVAVIVKTDARRSHNEELGFAEQTYDVLSDLNVDGDRLDVLLDDRSDQGAGWKTADASIIGIPIVVLRAPRMSDTAVTVLCRSLDFSQDVELLDAPRLIRDLMARLPKWSAESGLTTAETQ